MTPIYKFELSAGEDTQDAYPIYGNDLSKDFERQSNEQFFRAKLSGKLTFQCADYDFIAGQAFDTQFLFKIYISYSGGTLWQNYWQGTFWKTDCEFNDDDKTVIVTPTVDDQYNAVLAGMEKEFDLITLAPAIERIKFDKRPMIQIYSLGSTTMACFLSGMWWEQECQAVDNANTLRNTYHFSDCASQNVYVLTGEINREIAPVGSGYTFSIIHDYDEIGYFWLATLTRISDGAIWQYQTGYGASEPTLPLTLYPVSGTAATANVNIDERTIQIFGRYITDATSILGTPTQQLSRDNDICPDNRNYSRCIGYAFDVIRFSTRLTTTPTQWGILQPGQYYLPPSDLAKYYPVARNNWAGVSVWFMFSDIDWYLEENARKEYTLNNAYPIWSVISVLLGQIAPGITHAGTTDYSQFLYDYNPFLENDQRLFITPKSNILSAGYDQPAQKAPITLKMITDMLRDCFRCYWFIDSSNRFRIEHIEYFRNGGSYSGTPVVGIDLTVQKVSRNGLPWAYARNKYQFDKPDMAARYQFGWMDDVTELFNGFPIDIISKYVNPDNIEEISVSRFTSDIDYILLNPSAISPDGFVLLAAVLDENDEYRLPYETFTVDGAEQELQNAYAAFIYLQEYYGYDMPAPEYQIHGEDYTAAGVKKLKKQTINFPVLTDPDMNKLIKTELGNGTIEKMSVNLSSRNADTTLSYEPE